MIYIVESKDSCIVTADLRVFNYYYFSNDEPTVFRGETVADVLRKKIETNLCLNS